MDKAILVISSYSNLISPRPEAELFIALHHRGWNITIMLPESSPWVSRFQEEGVPLIFFTLKKRYDKTEVSFIRKTLVDHNIQLVILFNNNAVVNGLKAAKDLPVKTVVYRGSVGNVHWYDPTSYLKVLHPRVDYVLCLHPAVKAHLDKQLFFGPKKTKVMRKGHNPSWYDNTEPLKPEDLNLPTNGFFITFVGNVRSVKGIKYLLKSLKHLRDCPDIHLILIGNGFDQAVYQKLIESSGMKSRIHVLGYRKDALNIVAMSNVLVLPSLRSEALTKAVQEAMHLGVCPVITDIPGNKGLVQDGESGWVVPPANSEALGKALLYCWKNKEETQSMGQKAKNHISTWLNHETTITEAEKVLAEMLEGK
ncbi:MAG: glycosyltransferase [Cryomorphaceae bacterium]|nr:glycosyltransferase [Cryomorphaceae bacterium]